MPKYVAFRFGSQTKARRTNRNKKMKDSQAGTRLFSKKNVIVKNRAINR
jgi:hypothetical protein